MEAKDFHGNANVINEFLIRTPSVFIEFCGSNTS